MKTARRTPHPAGVLAPIPRAAMMVVLATLASSQAWAFEFNFDDSDVKLRWDNTLKYSAAARVKSRSDVLAPSDAAGAKAAWNSDDGDRNFSRGLISDRVDIFSEADLAYHDFGARVSATGWYDTVYTRKNDNNSEGLITTPTGSTSNSNNGYNRFSRGTRKLDGASLDLMDAFVYGKANVGDTFTTVRLGQHALVWGESLFLGANAIAGAQNPTDFGRLAAVPNTQYKEAVLPVPQISLDTVLNSTVSLGAYYQFKYVPNRLPAAGSYFNSNDLGTSQGPGIGYFSVGPQNYVIPVNVMHPKNGGQGGLKLHLSLGDTDVGFYAIRYTEKFLAVYPVLSFPTAGPPIPTPVNYTQARQQGIMAYGTSFDHVFGNFNLAGEASIRHNNDIPTAHLSSNAAANNNDTNNTAYPIGNTAHANLSTLWSIGTAPFWSDASFAGEVAWNRLLKCEKVCTAMPTNGTRDAWQLFGVFTPSYYQVLPGLNLSVPVGVSYTPKGSRSLALGAGASGPENGGAYNIGLTGLYLDKWKLGTTWQHFYGKAGIASVSNGGLPNFSYLQTLRDRDFVSMSIARTF